MLFRKLNLGDEAKYRSLRLFSLQESPFAFSESYEDECVKTAEQFHDQFNMNTSMKGTFIMGAFTNKEELVGFVSIARDTRSKALHKAFLHTMYVTPAYRSKGIGNKLIMNLRNEIEHLEGLEQIHLWVLLSDYNAVEFYEKAGFIGQGALVKQDLKIHGQYVDAMYMVKYLVNHPGS